MNAKTLDSLRIERRTSLSVLRRNVANLTDYVSDSKVLTEIARISKKLYDLSDLIEMDYKLMINEISECERIKARDCKLTRIAHLKEEIKRLEEELDNV